MDEVGSVVAAQGCVIVLQQFDDRVPTLACVVDHVVATHVHVELHPVHLLWQIQDICREETKTWSRKQKLHRSRRSERRTHRSLSWAGSGGWWWRCWSCRSRGSATGIYRVDEKGKTFIIMWYEGWCNYRLYLILASRERTSPESAVHNLNVIFYPSVREGSSVFK